MFKPQMKFQKVLFILLLIVSALCFVYSIGLMTDLYGLYQTKAIGGVAGAELFYDMQDYNHNLVLISIALVLISCLPFIFASNTRRKYYIGNIISTYIQAIAFALAAIFIAINNINYRNIFVNEVDFETWKSFAEIFSFSYSESTFFFDAGFVIAIVLIAASAALIYNLIWKSKLVKTEERILQGEIQNG